METMETKVDATHVWPDAYGVINAKRIIHRIATLTHPDEIDAVTIPELVSINNQLLYNTTHADLGMDGIVPFGYIIELARLSKKGLKREDAERLIRKSGVDSDDSVREYVVAFLCEGDTGKLSGLGSLRFDPGSYQGLSSADELARHMEAVRTGLDAPEGFDDQDDPLMAPILPDRVFAAGTRLAWRTDEFFTAPTGDEDVGDRIGIGLDVPSERVQVPDTSVPLLRHIFENQSGLTRDIYTATWKRIAALPDSPVVRVDFASSATEEYRWKSKTTSRVFLQNARQQRKFLHDVLLLHSIEYTNPAVAFERNLTGSRCNVLFHLGRWVLGETLRAVCAYLFTKDAQGDAMAPSRVLSDSDKTYASALPLDLRAAADARNESDGNTLGLLTLEWCTVMVITWIVHLAHWVPSAFGGTDARTEFLYPAKAGSVSSMRSEWIYKLTTAAFEDADGVTNREFTVFLGQVHTKLKSGGRLLEQLAARWAPMDDVYPPVLLYGNYAVRVKDRGDDPEQAMAMAARVLVRLPIHIE